MRFSLLVLEFIVFKGIIEGTGKILKVKALQNGSRLTVKSPFGLGAVKKGDKIFMFNKKAIWDVLEIGYIRFGKVPAEELGVGEAGYMICGIKDVHELKVGDTVTRADRRAEKPLPGYKDQWQMMMRISSDVFQEAVQVLKDAEYKVLTEYVEDLEPYLH